MERRCAVELRAAGDIRSPRLAGYAAVFNSESRDLGGFTEKIAPGAFARTLQSNSVDPLALVQHVPHLVLGRRSAGTLKLAEDGKGLSFEVVLPETTTARDLMVSVSRGDIRGASFAFSVPKGGDRWDVQGGRAVRTLLDVDLHEITITPTPAYQDTSVAVRAFKAQLVSAPRLRGLYIWLESCR